MAVASLAGVPSSIASITWWLRTVSNSSSRESDTLFWTLQVHTCLCSHTSAFNFQKVNELSLNSTHVTLKNETKITTI